MKFTTKVAGIPCWCEVTHYRPEVPPKLSGAFEDADPGEGQEFEFKILDRKGRHAPWLEKKLTDADIERLAEEYEATVLEDKYDF